MPSLFTLPSQVPLSTSGEIMAACTLTFSVSGTSTPQNTYSDIALATPHANPVVADAAGLFGAIYLDPSLPNYRVVLKTAAGLTLKTWDDVPSNQNTAQQFRLKYTTPALTFEETDGTANNKIWRLKVNGDQLLLTILNDAESVETTVFTFDRTGTTVDQLSFSGQYLRVNGVLVATQESTGPVTATLTGVNAVVTGSVSFRRSGSKVSVLIASSITGTSDATSMSLTGLGVLNGTGGQVVLCRVIDNGVTVLGTATIGTSSITFGVGAAGGVFTGSGTKGIPAGTLIMFDTDSAGIA
jgi:hypothetical protein